MRYNRSVADDELPPGGVEIPNPPWAAWPPVEVAVRLSGVRAPWYVASGWALDLFRGGPTRAHADIEIGVPIGDFDRVRSALPGFEIHVVGSGRRWPLDSPAYERMHQTWVYDAATGHYRLDIFREPHDGDVWIYRRDTRIRRPHASLIERTADGIPYLAPEVALLFKTKHRRDKDEADFAGALPLLDPARRAWLAEALTLVHPDHHWLSRL